MSDEEYPVCTADDYAAADADSSSMPASDEGSAVGSCPADEVTIVPCDVDQIILAEIPGADTKVYEYKGGAFTEKPPESATQRKVSSTGQDAPEGARLMMIADKQGADQPTKAEVTVVGTIGPCDGSLHPKIQASGPDGALIGQAAETLAVEVYREPYGFELTDSHTLKSLISPYWPLASDPNLFHFDVDVCGMRDAGSVHGARRFTVEVYPSDQYKLTLKIPPFKSTKHEVSKTVKRTSEAGIAHNETTSAKSKESTTGFNKTTGTGSSSTTSNKGLVDTKTESSKSTGSDGVVHSQSTTEGEKAGSAYIAEAESLHFQGDQRILKATESTEEALNVVLSPAPPGGVSFEISRNGRTDSTAQNLQQILFYLKNLEYTFKEIFNMIKRVPSIGWKATLDVSFFSGDLYMSWGFREAADWQVGYGYSLGADLKLIDIKGAISCGVELSVATAKIEGSITGTVSVKGEIAGMLKAGDATADLSGKLVPEGTVKVDINGDAMVGYPPIKVIQAKAGIDGGVSVKCEPKITKTDGLYFEYEIKVLPIAFYYQTVSYSGATKKRRYELTEAKQIAKGKFPEATPDDPTPQARKTGLVKS